VKSATLTAVLPIHRRPTPSKATTYGLAHYLLVAFSMSDDRSFGSLAGHRIMIVDDDPGIRRALYILLSREGCRVTQARDGAEALRMWRLSGGDLVITDLHMPEKDGIEMIVELMSHTPGIRIIAMSGGGQTRRLDLLGNAALLGAVLTIEKPFTLNEMMTTVRKALE
jgi:DNA-binding NtrC family response regulator